MNAYTKALGIAATPAGKGALRLHLNENGAGCSPAVLRALQSLTPELVGAYPDYGPAVSAIARAYGVPDDWVLLVNGLDEAVQLLSEAAATTDRPASFSGVVLDPAFDMYAVGIAHAGGRVSRVSPRPGFAFSLDDVLGVSATARLIYLTDPNNPTGIALTDDAIASIATARPGAIVFVDEAYADYAGRSFIPTLRANPSRFANVIVGRTFSKAHGLAGLRIGALIAPPDRLANIEAMTSPFNVNIAAAVAVEAALADTSWLRSTVDEARACKDDVYEFCARVGLTCWRSDANFVLIRVGETAADSAAVVDAMAARGILVRDRSAAAGCLGCIRLTTTLMAHTARALRALEEILASRTR